MKLLFTAICLLSLPFSIQATEKIVAEINVNALPASCINFSSGEVLSPQLNDGEYIDDFCLENGFEYYVEPRSNSTFNTIDAATAESFAKDIQFGDFADDFPGVNFEDIDESVIDFYFSGSTKGKGKGKGKSSFFRIGYADFGIYQTVSADGELHQGKIRKLDDDNIQIIAFVENIAPELTFVNLSDEITVGESYSVSFDNLLSSSDAFDEDGDSLNFVFEGSSNEVTLNGNPISIGDTISSGDSLSVVPQQLGIVSIMAVSVTDSIEKSQVVDVTIKVISKIAAIQNEITALKQQLRKLVSIKRSRTGSGRSNKAINKKITALNKELAQKKRELNAERAAQRRQRLLEKKALAKKPKRKIRRTK